MPIFDKGSLRQYCKLYSKLTFHQGAILLLGMLKGLWELHSHHTLHHNIKPHNIMVEGDEDTFDIVIADLGLAKEQMDKSLTSFCGTQSYMAPETADPAHGYTYKADVWSAAVVAM